MTRASDLLRASLLAGLVLSGIHAKAQLTVAPQTDLQQLAESISGPGVRITNPEINCHGQGYGEFEYTGSLLGLESGVVLTSGRITDAIGPNTVENKSFQQGASGSSLLNTVTGRTTYDACRFEFDVLPSGDSLSFQFVFGSEEYNEWVGSQFNDVFGFFISGPGIAGDPGIGNDHNIALIPGTSTAVAINNVNAGQNSAHYQYNAGGQELQMDGYTTGLAARSPVQACQTYHLKLIVADASDRKFDSWVFVERIESPSVTLSTRSLNGVAEMVEGCNPGWVRFTRDPVLATPLTLNYFLQGSATNGTDYSAIGNVDPSVAKSITIPGGAAFAEQFVDPIADAVTEPTEHLRILLGNPNCPGFTIDSIDFAVEDTLIATLSPTGVQTICLGGSVQVQVIGGANHAWSPADGLSCTDCPNPIASPTSSTTYTVVVTDGTCSRTMSRSVLVSDPTINATLTQPLCSGNTNGAINITVTGGYAPYSYAWSGPNGFTAASEDIANIEAGTYTVTVTDNSGCAAVQSYSMGSAAALGVTLTPSILVFGQNIACNGASTGTLSLAVSGGTGPHAIQWSGPNGFASTQQNLSYITAGTYNVLVTDANGCTASGSYTMTESTGLTLAVSGTQPITCFGGASGEASVTASGGMPPYSIVWNTVPPHSGATATGLPSGTHTATVTDGYGCTAQATATIGAPLAPLSVAIIGTIDVLCHDSLSGSAQAQAAGGTAPYSYSWSTAPSQDSANAIGLAQGTYTVTVTDATGCQAQADATIGGPQFEVWAFAESVTNVSCFGLSDGAATLDVSGGSGSYTITWNTVPPQSGLTATGLSAGEFLALVVDNNGCDHVKGVPVNITGPAAPLQAQLGITSISCAGSSNGAVNLTMSGGQAPYTHVWSDDWGTSTGAEDLSGLDPGTYYLHAFDALGCVIDTSFALTEPTVLAVTPSITPAACVGSQSGAIDLSIAGGTLPYSTLWSGTGGFTANTEDISGLNAGSYTVIVIDANSCQYVNSFLVSQPGGLQASITTSSHNGYNITCDGANDGSISLSVLGGDGNYTFDWNGPDGFSSNAEDLSALAAGAYTVLITDGNGCSLYQQATVTAPDPLNASALGTALNGYGVSCNGAADGAINLLITGGAAPFSTAWSGPSGYSSASGSITGLVAGAYSVIITDANGCAASASSTLTEPAALSATAVAMAWPDGTNTSCAGAADGAIDLSIMGGAPPYSIAWSDGMGFTAASEDVSGVSPGGYQAIVTDANGCTATAFDMITSPGPLALSAQLSAINNSNVSCAGAMDGSIDLSVSGGVAAYGIAWSTGSINEDLSGIGAGLYTVTVTDAHGCTATASYTLAEPQAIAIDLIAALQPGGSNISCNGAADGSLIANINGGEAPFTYAWSGPDGFISTDVSPNGLLAGNYQLVLTDAHGCDAYASAMLTEPQPVAVIIDSTVYSGGYTIPCAGLSAGTAQASALGGTPGYAFSWSGPDGYASSDASIFSLGAGAYNVIATDLNGCTGSASITLTAPNPLDVVIDIADLGGFPVSCIGNDGSASVAINGGATPYAITWSGPDGFASAQASISGLGVGEYVLNVIDANGCARQDTMVLDAPEPIAASFSFTANTCPGNAQGSIDLSLTGGAAPYAFAWSGPNGFSSIDEDPNALISGSYSVTVTDGLGCGGAFNADLTGPAPINTGAYVSFYGLYNLQCQDDSSGVIELTPGGGTTPFTVLINGPGGYSSADLVNNQLVAGDYQVTLTDANGCPMDTLVTLTEPATSVGAALSVSVYPSGTNVSCFGASDGWIDATLNGGSGPYTFDWRGPDSLSFSSEDIFNLPAGSYAYELVVTDANQCTFSTTVTLTQPDTLLYASAIVSAQNGFGVSCNGAADGSIDLSYGGGNGGYGISWSGPNGFASNDEDLSGLAAGTYTVTITDMNGCSLTLDHVLTAPQPIIATLQLADFNGSGVSCAGANDGSIAATVSGGAGGYQLLWNGPDGFSSTNAAISGLSAGTYCLGITDANGCTAQQCATVTAPQALEASTATTSASCGTANGAVDLSVSGGTAPFTYAWSNGSSAQDLTGLAGGTYAVNVTDANGCTATATEVVNATPAALGQATTTDVLCYGAGTGAIDLEMTTGTAPFSYAWSNGSGAQDLNGVDGGAYAITVTDSNGCTWNGQWTVQENAAMDLNVSTSSYSGGYEVSTHGGTDGSLSVLVLGGAPPYSYQWSNGSTASSQSGLPAGTYTVTITDANGCTVTRSITLEEPNDLLMPTGYTPNGDGHNDVFFIQGLDAYPGNLITVLNRWGNAVFEQLNYKNDWAGDNARGEPLPNGTYFIILSINDGQRTLQGYVDLRR